MENEGGNSIRHPGEDKLAECRVAISIVRKTIRELLSRVAIAPEGAQKLSAWNTIDTVHEALMRVNLLIREALKFIEEDVPGDTNQKKSKAFRNALESEIKEMKELRSVYKLRKLQSGLEHSEQSMVVHWDTLSILRDTLTIAENNGANSNLAEIAINKEQLRVQRDRVPYELGSILRVLDSIINHPRASDIPNKKLETYHAKWKYYNNQLLVLKTPK